MTISVLPQDRIQILKRLIKQEKFKLLFFDLETSPMTVETHYIGNKVCIYPDQITDESRIITIQYMFEGDKEPYYLQWEGSPGNWSDASIIEEFITDVLNQENIIIVGQNHKDFDHRVLNWRANLLGLHPPLQDMIKLDVLKLAKTAFRAPSYKLDFRSKRYGLGGKIKMEMADWMDIKLKGDQKKLAKMIDYGCKDVLDLRAVFWKELPYYEKLPAPLEKMMGIETIKCDKCESKRQRKFDVIKVKIKNKNHWKCENCGDVWI